jgi:hypothetical protein
MKKIYDDDPDIILIQEPYEYQNRITGIDKKVQNLYSRNWQTQGSPNNYK